MNEQTYKGIPIKYVDNLTGMSEMVMRQHEEYAAEIEQKIYWLMSLGIPKHFISIVRDGMSLGTVRVDLPNTFIHSKMTIADTLPPSSTVPENAPPPCSTAQPGT